MPNDIDELSDKWSEVQCSAVCECPFTWNDICWVPWQSERNRSCFEAFDLRVKTWKLKKWEKGSGKEKREADEIRSGQDFDPASNPEIYLHIHIHVSTWVPPTLTPLRSRHVSSLQPPSVYLLDQDLLVFFYYLN